MKTKKIPYYLLVGSLTFGASLILGFLSFTGAMALWPIVPVASVFFALSVGYEGEIYLQNIKGALDKLGFKGNFMHRKLARQYLSEYAPSEPGKKDPLFFHDYMNLLALRDQYKRKVLLNLQDRKRKKALNKAIKKMEKWFTLLLFKQKNPENSVEQALLNWLESHQQSEWLTKANHRQFYYYLSAVFAGVSGLSISFGTTYLLLGALSSMPVIIAASPIWLTIGITVASLVAGAAYALLTFNTITDLIENETVQNWLKKLKHNLVEAPTVRSVLVSSVALILFTLALALTVCTAGTWWTVIKQTPPLFRWMAKIPSYILMVFPVINGAAALTFNFENTAASIKMVDEIIEHQPPKPSTQKFIDTWNNLIKNERFWQRLNPFRLLLKLTFTPLRILLFLGHLVSIALTSDRLPGVPQIVSFLVGLICEGFEDAHYFLGFSNQAPPGTANADILKAHFNDEEEDHNHNNDLPTRFLHLLFTPLFYLAALWDYNFSDTSNWQRACGKFKLNDNVCEDETIANVEIESSLHLSKLGMAALQNNIKSTLSITTTNETDNQEELIARKLGFFDVLKPLISDDDNHLDVNYSP